MNIARNERLLDKLAAEYVLGTLRGGARRRYEDLLRADPLVQRATAQWQNRLYPLAELTPSVIPPDSLWPAIHRRLDLPAVTPRATTPVVSAAASDRWAFWRNLHNDLGFWRGLGMASTAVATILVAVLATRAPAPVQMASNAPAPAPVVPAAPTPTQTPNYVAMLADDRAQPVAVVTGDVSRHLLTVRLVAPQAVAADRSLQLWAIPKAGNPRSLGLLAADGSISLPLPADATPQTVAALAVSLEPKGGSPKTDAPTGPVLFKGAWLAI